MNATRRIALLLTAVFLIPVLFFSAYEISSLSRDEKMIESIYQKQLEAILFSINQYSEDLVSKWVAKSENLLLSGKFETGGRELLLVNAPLQLLFSYPLNPSPEDPRFVYLDTSFFKRSESGIAASLAAQQDEIAQLVKYKKSGFQKTAVLSQADTSLNRYLSLIFIAGDEQQQSVTGFVLDPEAFVEELMGPRLQQISENQFVLSVTRKTDRQQIYSTQLRDSTSTLILQKDLWLFPDYVIGIGSAGSSWHEVVRSRTQTNLLLLLVMAVMLVVALVLAFRSLRQEVQLAQNKADFVSNVSHEIRTPLALISMFAETLEMGRVPGEEKKKEYYAIIHKEAHRLTGIVNKILNFSQAEAGKKKMQPERLDLVHEAKEILNTYDFHLKNKGFSYELKSDAQLWVMADQAALAEIIINLIDNAMKYSQDTKRIELTTGREGTNGYLSVRDIGVGISLADQKHIFDKFYRVSTGNLAKASGTGLGLSLVKQLLEQQNGTISVKSDVGQGSVFTIFLPLAN
ncbi:MAG: sensor histidine kinase [Cyclobacteriaceae bacterium]|jgi:two-component system phosphate regulon sensor histidine kinase PhoR